MKSQSIPYLAIPLISAIIIILGPVMAKAHCDTMDGPVIKDAAGALERGDISPVLKWIRKEHEQEITDAFNKTLVVRAMGTDAKELADNYFFETLVRIHRKGEGEPYSGLKPAGAGLEPAVAEADRALENGSVDELVNYMTGAVSSGIRERFEKAYEARKHANQNVDAGREFVEAYVQFVHFVERLHVDATTSPEHHGDAGAKDEGIGHKH